jgi:5-methylcytosine-specific restriction endonuclease McrA
VVIYLILYENYSIGDAIELCKKSRPKISVNFDVIDEITKNYKIASENKVPYSPYSEKLKDKKWKAFRNFVFVVRGCKCEMCGATQKLQVHHPKYVKGRKAWEYTCNEVVVLCEQCHRKAHGLNY